MTKLSVITICYNEPNLEETCKSIVNQSWQDFEWIVIDGGSNKETLDIFEKYKYRIDKFISEPDNGIYNAMNKGIKLAKGQYLIFMNAGDSFYTNKILQLVAFYMNDDSIDIFHGECEFSFKENPRHNFITNTDRNLTKQFLIDRFICTQGVFIKRELFHKYGYYDEKFKIAEDYEKWLQFFDGGQIFQYLPIIVAMYDANGISGNFKTRKLAVKERNEIRDKYFTKEEIDRVIESNENIIYSPIEQIFSMKNHPNGREKVITILGMHFKIRRNNK